MLLLAIVRALITCAGSTMLQAAGVSAAFRRAIEPAMIAAPAQVEHSLAMFQRAAALAQGNQFGESRPVWRHACPGGLDNSARSCHFRNRQLAKKPECGCPIGPCRWRGGVQPHDITITVYKPQADDGRAVEMAGPVESVEKQKRLSHPFHRPWEISQTARDFHIPTARLRDGDRFAKLKTRRAEMIALRADDGQTR